jgi:hypothetical protein
MHGIADDNAHDPKAPAEPSQRAQILAPVVPPFKGQNRLRRQPQFV